jgi:membrane protein YdbS with pleckstrin-like domain
MAGAPRKVTDVDELFTPPSGDWQRVSPKLATIRRILIAVPAAVILLAGLVLLVMLSSLWWIGALLIVVALAAAGWGWVWAGRNQRSWGYAENDDDLLVTSGVMFKRLVAIPYGRMQFVDVEAGPLDRAYGVATVTLHTASTETAADIPGLPASEATRLRNRLTELGEAHGAGL